jgi:hypothetical protein
MENETITCTHTEPISLRLAPDGKLVAIVNTKGQYGLVIHLETGEVTMPLERDTYHIEHSQFPVAFFQADQLLLVHSTQWNRLDISDPYTGKLLSVRPDPPYQQDQPNAEHYLDYFHAGLSVSPDQQWIVDNGWIWHPIGAIMAWDLQRWVQDNVWESERGPSYHGLCHREYYWDGPLCWIGPQTLAIWGYGEDDEWLIPAVRIFDVPSGKEFRWFAGPDGSLFFDEYLFSFGKDGLSAWDIITGERVLHTPDFRPTHYHRGTKQFLQLDNQSGTAIAHLGTLSYP